MHKGTHTHTQCVKSILQWAGRFSNPMFHSYDRHQTPQSTSPPPTPPQPPVKYWCTPEWRHRTPTTNHACRILKVRYCSPVVFLLLYFTRWEYVGTCYYGIANTIHRRPRHQLAAAATGAGEASPAGSASPWWVEFSQPSHLSKFTEHICRTIALITAACHSFHNVVFLRSQFRVIFVIYLLVR